MQPPKAMVAEENFPKFVLSIENSMAIFDSYTYNSLLKKVRWRVVKKIKIFEIMEEEIMKQ